MDGKDPPHNSPTPPRAAPTGVPPDRGINYGSFETPPPSPTPYPSSHDRLSEIAAIRHARRSTEQYHPTFSTPSGASGDVAGFLLSRSSFDQSSRLMQHRHGSRGQFSRLRRRSARRDTTQDFRGDFIIHDFINSKTRSHVLHREHEREERGRWAQYLYSAKIYFVLVTMGIGAGLIAAGLDMCVDWLSDLKFGLCTRAWYLSEDMCCKLGENESECSYRTWAQLLGHGWILIFSEPIRAFFSYLTCAILFATFAAYLVKRFAPHAAGSGVPEIKTILSGVVIRGYLNPWTFVTKVIGLSFSVSSGLNLGKEGPFVHLVSALSNLIATRFADFRNNFSILVEFITVGTAAGVSVAFNAPIGGVLFAFEEAASYFPNRVLWRSFFASALAELTLKMMNPFYNGRAVMFEIDHSLEWYWFELIIFFFVGAVGGVLGSIFIFFNVKYSKLRIHHRFLKRSPIIEVLCITVLTVLLQYPVPFLRSTNTEILTSLFVECPQPGTGEGFKSLVCDQDKLRVIVGVLVYAMIAKLFLTILTFGARIPAGLFIPSMTIGACAGRLIGIVTKLVAERHKDWLIFSECRAASVCVRPSMYALVGASAALAGVTQVSVSLVVIMFELTGGLSHLLPTMFSILAAKMICDMSGLEGIYDMHINLKRYPFLDSKHHVSTKVGARIIMRPPRVFIPEMGFTLGSLRTLLNENPYYGFPIVHSEADMILTGNITRWELGAAIERAMNDPHVTMNTAVSFKGEFDQREVNRISASNEVLLNFAGYRDRYLCQVNPETPVSDVHDCFSLLGVRMCYVTRHGELLGLISKKDIIAYCDAAEDVPREFF